MEKIKFTPLTPIQFIEKYLHDTELTKDWVEWALLMYAEHCVMYRDFTNAHNILEELLIKIADFEPETDNVTYWCEICTHVSHEPGPCQNCGHKTQ
jgi:hypothetical protein